MVDDPFEVEEINSVKERRMTLRFRSPGFPYSREEIRNKTTLWVIIINEHLKDGSNTC